MDILYMNNAATSWPKPEEVYQSMDYFNRNTWASPGRGSNRKTIEAGMVLLETRESLAKLFNIKDLSRLIFTKNVTESANLSLKGWLDPGDHIITTSMEHNAVARPLYYLEKQGVEVTYVACAGDGSLDPLKVREALQGNTKMICITHASNVTGTIMPVDEVGKIARENEIVFMVDAAQSAGVLPIDVEKQGIDLLAFTGHKGLLGPQGTGGLYIRPGLELKTLIEGGTGSFSEHLYQPDFLPDRYESGTPNTPGIAGLGAGVNFILKEGIENICRHERSLTDILISGLREIKGIKIYGPLDSLKQTAVLSINLSGMDCGELSFNLDEKYGIITRSGLHCAPLAHQTIGTLEEGTCRLSPGYFNTIEEMEYVIKSVQEIACMHK